jgi:hypothetical protein
VTSAPVDLLAVALRRTKVGCGVTWPLLSGMAWAPRRPAVCDSVPRGLGSSNLQRAARATTPVPKRLLTTLAAGHLPRADRSSASLPRRPAWVHDESSDDASPGNGATSLGHVVTRRNQRSTPSDRTNSARVVPLSSCLPAVVAVGFGGADPEIVRRPTDRAPAPLDDGDRFEHTIQVFAVELREHLTERDSLLAAV